MYLLNCLCIVSLISFACCEQPRQNIPSSIIPSQPFQFPIDITQTEDGCILSVLQREIARELPRRLSPTASVLLPGTDDFKAIDERYTNYQRPSYVIGVRAAIEQDVIETLHYARSRSIPFVVRNGAHSLTTSLRRIKMGIVIDIRNLRSISFDAKNEQVTIGGGISTGEFANATHLQGMEVTVGSCPCTGVMGVALGAGIGRLQGRYGYLHDNIVSLRLLLANGTVVEVSQDNHPDIYWAVRGAGHNFGIVLSATVQVYPQKHEGLHFVVDFEFAIDRLESIFEILNDLASPMPENIAVFVIGRKKGASGSPTININLVAHGPRSDAAAYIAKFASLSPVFTEEKVVSWNSLPWETYRGLNNVLCTPEGWARYPIKQFSAANVKSYDIQTMRSFFDSWVEMNEKYDGHALFSLMFESFPQQGVRRRARNSTAYPWRFGSDHFLMMEVASKTVEHEDVYAKWLSEQQEAFVATSGYGRLQQYVNYGNGHSDPPEALYGYEPWRLERLRKIKSQLDPEGLFNGYQPFVLDLE